MKALRNYSTRPTQNGQLMSLLSCEHLTRNRDKQRGTKISLVLSICSVLYKMNDDYFNT